MRSFSIQVAFGLVFVATACDATSSSPTGAAASATSAVVPSPNATAVDPPLEAPDDLDVAAVQKSLKCAADAKSGLCAILAKARTGTPWNPLVPSGDGRWIGRGIAIENGKSRDTFVIVRARRVPMVEVAPGQMGVKIGIAEIPKEDPAFAQADHAIRAYERSDTPPRNNAAIDYLKALKQWPESYAMKTKGGQIDALAQEGAYFSQGPKQEILLIQRASKNGSDGLYAELWPATW